MVATDKCLPPSEEWAVPFVDPGSGLALVGDAVRGIADADFAQQALKSLWGEVTTTQTS